MQTLNHAAQQIRVQAADLDPRGRTVQTDAYTLHRGDQIVTRHNEQRLLSDQGLRVRNRDEWTIQRIHRSGDITATGDKGTIRLPSRYVNSHVELAYAQTAHATQGRTVDRSILLIDGPTDVRSLYVPLTRGRDSNDAYIVTRGEQTAVDVFADAIGRSWIDHPALARQAELRGHNTHRPGTLTNDQLRDLYNIAARLQATLDQHADKRHWLPKDLAVAEHNLAEATVRREHLADSLTQARQTLAQHDRPFHRRGNEEQIAVARNRLSLLPQQIDDTDRQIAQHQATIHETRAQLDQASRFDQQRPELEQQLDDTWDRIHDDADIRSRQLRFKPTDTVIQRLGSRPIGDHLAQTWDHTAGQLDQHWPAYDTLGTPNPNDPGHTLSHNTAADAIDHLNLTIRRETELEQGIERGFGIGL